VRIEDAGAAFEQADTGGLEQRAIEVLELRDLAILVRDQRRPREFGLRRPAIRTGVLEVIAIVGGIDEQFFRDAAPDHAGAARPVGFADSDTGAEPGGHSGRAHAGRSRTDDEQVESRYPPRVAPGDARPAGRQIAMLRERRQTGSPLPGTRCHPVSFAGSKNAMPAQALTCIETDRKRLSRRS
jgi:hypothetical protein